MTISATRSDTESARVGVIAGHLRDARDGLGAILNQAGVPWDAFLTLTGKGTLFAGPGVEADVPLPIGRGTGAGFGTIVGSGSLLSAERSS